MNDLDQCLTEGFAVVIETDQYAGRFERELTAYCTGFVGECEAGRELSDLFYRDFDISDDEDFCADEKNPFRGFIGDRQDDTGTWRPCSVWMNPRYGCKSDGTYSLLNEENYSEYNFPAFFAVAIYFEVKPDKSLLDIITDRAKKFFDEVYPEIHAEPIASIERIRLLRQVIGVEDLGDVYCQE